MKLEREEGGCVWGGMKLGGKAGGLSGWMCSWEASTGACVCADEARRLGRGLVCGDVAWR
eukprot:352864-Chlamydomonas_euryale.AAC.5